MYDEAATVVALLREALSELNLDGPEGLVSEDMENEAELLEWEPPLKQVVQGHWGLFVRGGGGVQWRANQLLTEEGMMKSEVDVEVV